jgi:hypothetical protein
MLFITQSAEGRRLRLPARQDRVIKTSARRPGRIFFYFSQPATTQNKLFVPDRQDGFFYLFIALIAPSLRTRSAHLFMGGGECYYSPTARNNSALKGKAAACGGAPCGVYRSSIFDLSPLKLSPLVFVCPFAV